MTQYVCTRCKTGKACTFDKQGDHLPLICHFDSEGRVIQPIWHEVPEKKGIVGFPDYIARRPQFTPPI